jgi:hypothetical protein
VDAAYEFGFQHEVFRGVANQLQFRANEQIRASSRRFAPHLQHPRGVPLKITHPLVHLGKCNLQLVGHAADLATIPRPATFTAPRLPR